MGQRAENNRQLRTKNRQLPLRSNGLITGMGAWSAGGTDLPTLWKNTLQGYVAATIETFPHLESALPVYRASSPRFEGQERAFLRNADRAAHLALAAAHEAWNHAGLTIGDIPPERIGVIIGSARGPINLQEKYAASPTSTDVHERPRPSVSLYTTFSSIAGLVAKAFKVEGPSFMVSSSCTSAATALHAALGIIQSGLLDVVIVGGVEAPLMGSLLEQYQGTGILSTQQPATQALTPFDRDRSGTVLGEGAAFVILESEASVIRRNASVLGHLKAIALASQSRYRTGLDPEGTSLQKILHHSLQEASLLPHDIALLHLHGTGTRLNDLLESHAVASFFGSLTEQPYACATKAITGHTLGAAALFQVVLTLCALRDGIVPPVTNCRSLDPECSLRLATTNTTLNRSSKALCLTLGFWGNISSVILSR
ncbi:MAG: beta-ketoacyl synthase N-terminal-like domain-containing protein [Chthoniobacterales bacterium]